GEVHLHRSSVVVECGNDTSRDHPLDSGFTRTCFDDDVGARWIGHGVVDGADATIRRLDVVADQVTVQGPGGLAVVPHGGTVVPQVVHQPSLPTPVLAPLRSSTADL